MASRRAQPVPAVWCIDVEPDGFAPAGEPWTGFASAVELVDRVRSPLTECSGHSVHPTWLFRLDAAIAQGCGRADFVLERHGDLVDRLVAAGDTFGIHVHPYRWDAAQAAWYTDNTDPEWTRHCIGLAAETFARRFGYPPRVHRSGGYHLTDVVIDACAELGIEVDLTAEPGLAAHTEDPSFASWCTEPCTDFRAFPTRPQRRADGALLLVPLSAYDHLTARTPWHRRIARRVLRRAPYGIEPLNPWKQWPSPETYWDMVARMLDESAHPYFAFAMRTDPVGSHGLTRVTALLEHLPSHPVARRLRFVDPLSPSISALAD